MGRSKQPRKTPTKQPVKQAQKAKAPPPLSISRTPTFKRDYKREKRTDANLDNSLVPVLELLAGQSALPAKLNDHALAGAWKGHRDCHVKPDLVLIYRRSKAVVELVRLGSHSELF